VLYIFVGIASHSYMQSKIKNIYVYRVRCKTGVFDKKRIRHHFKIGFRC
jgi:hypothetical protein